MARPRKHSSADEIAEIIDAYFADCEEKGIIPVWEEILLALDITINTWDLYLAGPTDEEIKNYDSLSDKEKREIDNKRAVSDTIKKTQQRLTAKLVRNAQEHPNCTTAMIYLTKQKHYGGYSDRQQIDSNNETKVSVNIVGVEAKPIK